MKAKRKEEEEQEGKGGKGGEKAMTTENLLALR